MVDCVEASWENGADLVLLPEFTWVGLQPLVEPKTLQRVAEVFWGELLPALKSLLCLWNAMIEPAELVLA